jgi:hypothetical protein
MSIFSWQHAIFFFATLCASGLHADVAAQLSLLNHAAPHNFNKIEPAKALHSLNLKIENIQQSAHEQFGSKNRAFNGT